MKYMPKNADRAMKMMVMDMQERRRDDEDDE
jgi:hypothetical protein